MSVFLKQDSSSHSCSPQLQSAWVSHSDSGASPAHVSADNLLSDTHRLLRCLVLMARTGSVLLPLFFPRSAALDSTDRAVRITLPDTCCLKGGGIYNSGAPKTVPGRVGNLPWNPSSPGTSRSVPRCGGWRRALCRRDQKPRPDLELLILGIIGGSDPHVRLQLLRDLFGGKNNERKDLTDGQVQQGLSM